MCTERITRLCTFLPPSCESLFGTVMARETENEENASAAHPTWVKRRPKRIITRLHQWAITANTVRESNPENWRGNTSPQRRKIRTGTPLIAETLTSRNLTTARCFKTTYSTSLTFCLGLKDYKVCAFDGANMQPTNLNLRVAYSLRHLCYTLSWTVAQRLA